MMRRSDHRVANRYARDSDIPIPEKLIRVPYWDPARAARARKFTLDMSTMNIGPTPDQ